MAAKSKAKAKPLGGIKLTNGEAGLIACVVDFLRFAKDKLPVTDEAGANALLTAYILHVRAKQVKLAVALIAARKTDG